MNPQCWQAQFVYHLPPSKTLIDEDTENQRVWTADALLKDQAVLGWIFQELEISDSLPDATQLM